MPMPKMGTLCCACIYSNPRWAKPQNKDNAKDYIVLYFEPWFLLYFDRIISRYLILDFHASSPDFSIPKNATHKYHTIIITSRNARHVYFQNYAPPCILKNVLLFRAHNLQNSAHPSFELKFFEN